MVFLLLKDPSELFVKRREFLPGSLPVVNRYAVVQNARYAFSALIKCLYCIFMQAKAAILVPLVLKTPAGKAAIESTTPTPTWSRQRMAARDPASSAKTPTDVSIQYRHLISARSTERLPCLVVQAPMDHTSKPSTLEFGFLFVTCMSYCG